MIGKVPSTVFLAVQQTLLGDGIACLCESSRLFKVCATVSDGDSVSASIVSHSPDIALLDMAMERVYALQLLHEVRERAPRTKIVVLCEQAERRLVIEALRAGASGIFLKSGSGAQLLDCLEQIMHGGIYVSPAIDLQRVFTARETDNHISPLDTLSSREYQVFRLMVEGVRAKEIAARLKVSPKTVDSYRAGLMRKIGVQDIAGLVKFAIHKGLTS